MFNNCNSKMSSFKHLQYLLVSFALCFGNSGCYAQKPLNLPEGRTCTIGQDKSSNNICRKINDCPSALQDLRKNIRPVVCSFNTVETNNPIVCCRQVKTYTAAEKCLEYSALIYTNKKSPILLTSEYNSIIKVKDCVNVEPLISGGIEAKPKEFPHMAMIGFHETKDSEIQQWLCGGSLISLAWILSAAHCDQLLDNMVPRFARLGQLNYDEPSDSNQQDFGIKERVVHPQYRRTLRYHDIALFRLDRDVIPTPFVRPLCLHTEKSIPSNKVVATGWGQKALGESRSPALLKVSLDIMSVTQCNSTYYNRDKTRLPNGVLDKSMVCAGVDGTGKDTCNGDSGGPIQIPHPNKNFSCLYSQVGITSFGQSFCGVDNTAAVYTRVSQYLPWIELIVWPKT